ncbi:MAG: transglutaminase domain-containing protein [Bacteroidales bacterium]|nr:transglutaminase domain-containing protein [Bacteroidales bacterium]
MKKITTAIAALSLLAACTAPQQGMDPAYSWEEDLHHRILVDFNKTEDQVREYIQQYIPEVTDSMMRAWEASGVLECMEIDGQKLYFRNAGPNLFRVDSLCRTIKAAAEIGTPELGGSEEVNVKHLPNIIADVKAGQGKIVQPKRMRVTYTLTIDADAVPAGENIRCWLPFPRTDIGRQTEVKLISTSEEKYEMAPDTAIHHTLYMEKVAQAGQPTIFTETFEYTSAAEWHNLQPEDIKPYDTTTELYQKYTAERGSHIIFSDRLKKLAAQLTAGETNPLLKARKLFQYVNDGFPWASAREYSTLENIPEYVLDNHKGDCGQVTLLFVTLCRICGIPAHFQSGFMMHPGQWNLHDWGEVYFEGIGWVPVDMSFGIPTFAKGQTDDQYWFFLGGIDSWRMVVNQDYGMQLHPAKTYPRSETVDFQRGEVEWAKGNIYFDQWDYHMDIDYLNE